MAKKKEPPPVEEVQSELSVLDYFKALITPGIPLPEIPQLPSADVIVKPAPQAESILKEMQMPRVRIDKIPWFPIAGLLIALFAQRTLSSTSPNLRLGLIIFGFSFAVLLVGYLRGEINIADIPEESDKTDSLRVKMLPLLIGAVFLLLAYIAFGGNQFNSFNVTLWVVGIGLILYGLWEIKDDGEQWFKRVVNFIRQPNWPITITPWAILVFLITSVVIFFRIYQLGEVIPIMFGDHSEKLFDVKDLLEGQTSIFFPRNTGREALQFYLTAAVSIVFNTGVSFMSLKLGTVLIGLFSLVYTYLLGKEVGNRWTGLFALFFIGISAWPNILARVGLRYILYPAFGAAVLYHVIRGLRTKNRNEFIWAGIFLGIGVHGYTPFRIMPVMVVITFFLAFIHMRSSQDRKQAIVWLGLVGTISMVIFLPLLRFWIDNPEVVNYRSLTRVTNLETEIPGTLWQAFVTNFINGMGMWNWNAGNTWVVNLPFRPILDVISGALFLVGVFLVLVRYIKKKTWQDLVLVAGLPILMMPSILSLAFPSENPVPSRGGGSMIVVFVLAAIGLEGLLQGIRHKLRSNSGKYVTFGVGALLLFGSASQNYDYMFKEFHNTYVNGLWNTNELGDIMGNFSRTVSSKDNVWVVAYPHWVDSRLVAIEAGYPGTDNAVWPDQIINTLEVPGTKMFFYNLADEDAIRVLKELYPNGANSLYQSEVEGRDFYIYYVPAEDDGTQN